MTKQWRPIPNEPNYEVSDHGDIRRLTNSTRGKRGDLLRPVAFQGYRVVILCNNGNTTHYRVHRLVMAAFVGVSDSFVNHKNGIRHDNRLTNLEYCTQQENVDHAISILGRTNNGAMNPNSKLNDIIIREIFSMRSSGLLLRDIALKVGVTKSVICRILKRQMWGHVSIPPHTSN